jgi:hypothetical protein
VVVLLHLLLVLRWSPATPPEIPPLCIHRLLIAEPHSFSDSSRYLLLFVTFVATVTVSNLAIAAAAAFRKSLVALPSPQNYADLCKTTNRASLGAHVTLAAALQRICVILAVAAVYF